MKIVVIGANGQLGCDITMAFSSSGHSVIPLNHDTVDVASFDSIKAELVNHNPQIVINTAAMHNVEKCEADPGEAFRVNAIGARNLAILSMQIGFTLLHISTDYVFDGNKCSPYLETDSCIPLNVYGNTKYSGECFIKTMATNYFIFRVSGLYGTNPCRAKSGRNFVKNMLKLAEERDEIRVVNSEVLTPTFTEDIASQAVEICKTNHFGTFHVTAQGECSWYQFASKIFELTGKKVNLQVADPGEFAAKVPRPNYSVLENHNLKRLGLDIMPSWEEGLEKYLDKSCLDIEKQGIKVGLAQI